MSEGMSDELRGLVGYRRRLEKMTYVQLIMEARRVDAQIFSGIIRPELILRILEVQDLDDKDIFDA